MRTGSRTFGMKTTLLALAFLPLAFSALAQTPAPDNPAKTGSQIGAGVEAPIPAPEDVGPRTGPTDPANGVFTTPPPEISPTPPLSPNAGVPANPADPQHPDAGSGTAPGSQE